MFHRSNTILAQSSQSNIPQWGSGYRVVVCPKGGRVAAAGSGVNTITLDAGHGFRVGDKFLKNPGSDNTFSEAITSVTATTITISSATYSVAVGDLLVNIGADTSSGSSPSYDASPMAIFTDPDGGTAVSNAILTASSLGNYDYFYRGDGGCWELILDSASSPASVVTGFAGQDRFNVVDFGAKGDGSTEDQKSIQAAIDAAEQLGGKQVFFPDGTYLVGEISSGVGLTVDSDNMKLVGSGQEVSIIKGKSGSYTANDIVVVDDCDHFEVCGLTFDGNSASWGNGVRVRGVRYSSIHHLYCKNFDNHGVSVRASASRGSTEVVIDNVNVNSGRKTGIIVYSENGLSKNTHIKISNCVSHSAGTFYGFEIRYSDYCEVVNCTAYGNTLHGFVLEESAYHCVLSNCVSFNNTGAGFSFEGGTSAVEWAVIDGCQSYSNTSHGINNRSSSNNIISNCIIRDNGGSGYHDESTSPGNKNSLINCVVESNDVSGVRVYGDNFTLQGGKVTNNGSVAQSNFKGLWLQSTANKARIVGTRFTGNVDDTTDTNSADIYTPSPLTCDHIIETDSPGFSYVSPRKSRFPGWHAAVHMPHNSPPNQAVDLTTDNSSFNADLLCLMGDTQYDRLFDIPLSTLYDSGANDDIGAATKVHVAARVRAVDVTTSVRWSDGTDFTNSDDVTIGTSENWRWISKDITLTSLSSSYIQSLRVQSDPGAGYILCDGVMITLS